MNPILYDAFEDERPTQPIEYVACRTCEGHGAVLTVEQYADGSYEAVTRCPKCRGVKFECVERG